MTLRRALSLTMLLCLAAGCDDDHTVAPEMSRAPECVDYANTVQEPLGTLETASRPWAIAIKAPYMIVANDYVMELSEDGSEWVPIGLVDVVDVSDPLAPSIVTTVRIPRTRPLAIEVVGEIAYVMSNWHSVHTIDLTDPRNPRVLGELQVPGEGVDTLDRMDVRFPYLFLWSYHTVRVVDASDPSNLVFLGEVPSFRVFASDERGTYISSTDGFWVVDLTDPLQPYMVDGVNLEGPGTISDLAVQGEVAYVAHGTSLQLWWIKFPDQLTLLDRIDLPTTVTRVIVDESHVYVGTDDLGILVFDITDPPGRASLVGSIPLASEVLDLALDDGMLYGSTPSSVFATPVQCE